jgi:adenylate kinase
MLNLVLFGPPGSGKGTQSSKLIEKYGLIHLSTGDLLRSEIAAKTELGLNAKEYMDKGLLVPDEVVIGMIDSTIKNHADAKGFLFDGFPRTTVQAKALDDLLEKYKTSINQVLALEVEEEELIKRLLNRGKTSGRPDDGNETVVRDRIEEYLRKTKSVEAYYEQQGKVQHIKGEGSVENIFALLSSAIDAML